MNKAFIDCNGCEQAWHIKRTHTMWYDDFSSWVSVGQCSVVSPAVIPDQKIVVPQAQFYDCLEEWFLTDLGRFDKRNMVFDADGDIKAWR